MRYGGQIVNLIDNLSDPCYGRTVTIRRQLHEKLSQMARKFPAVAVTGPRQSGKTTLVQSAFPQKPYVSLEDPDTREFALRDPRGFLSRHAGGAILDEIQRTPELFSYLQAILDTQKRPGQFILTGSHHLLLLENLSQTLAGRVRMLTLLPFGLEEMRGTPWEAAPLEEFLLKGMYPRIYDQDLKPVDWYPDYIQMYLERDVRLIKNINDLTAFQRFLKLCAGRTGCLLNLSSLAQDCGITHNTARSWLGILEASFLVFLLQPHYRNFKKRLVKTPKLYLYDTGLACALLGIETIDQLDTHPMRGNLFETFVLCELMKRRLHRGLPANLFFWRDKTGHEIDCLMEEGADLLPIEIQSGKTVTEDSLRNLRYWIPLAGRGRKPSFLITAGDQPQTRGPISILGWRDLEKLP